MRVERHAALDGIAAEWDDLAERVGAAPWLRPGWIGAWREAFGRGELLVVAVRHGARLAGLVPLEVTRGAVRSPTNWHTPAFGFLVEDDAAAAELAGALVADRPRHVSLAFVDPHEAGLEETRAAASEAGCRVLVRTLQRSPYLVTTGDWGDYESGLDSTMVRNLRRRRRQLEAEGTVSFDSPGWADSSLDEALAEAFAIEAGGWKGERGTAIASSPTTLRFYTDVARWAHARGSLRLTFLRLDAHAVAFELALEERGVHYSLKIGYDPEFRRFSPGRLLDFEVLRRAFEGDIAEFDFLGDADPPKLAWTHTVRERVRFDAFAPTPGGLVDYAALCWGRPLAKRALSLARR